MKIIFAQVLFLSYLNDAQTDFMNWIFKQTLFGQENLFTILYETQIVWSFYYQKQKWNGQQMYYVFSFIDIKQVNDSFLRN